MSALLLLRGQMLVCKDFVLVARLHGDNGVTVSSAGCYDKPLTIFSLDEDSRHDGLQ